MKTTTIAWIVLAVIIVIGGVYWLTQSGGGYPPSSQTATSSQSAATPPQTPVTPTVTIATSSSLGSFLVAENGMTLYTHTKDAVGTSTCYDTCANKWPPYSVTSGTNLLAGPDVTGTLGTITRTDGTLQVTYNGKPLYFYARDTSPGDTMGSGITRLWVVARS